MTAVDPNAYVQGVLQHDRRMLAKAITLVESSRHDHQQQARVMIEKLLPHAGGAVRLGITGVPGAGKSTFIESLGMYLVSGGRRVAVLAVDPSSTRSGGSVMADKMRMERLAAQHQAFIRPSPSGGTLGGVARKTRETMVVCEAAGFDVVIVETVGVGQSETAVASMVDFFLVLMLPGAGDEIQGIKKGILELADALAVNKADGDNLARARKARADYEMALHLLHPESPLWSPSVVTCSALEMTGIDTIWKTVLRHRDTLTAAGALEEKRRQQAQQWMWALIEEGLREQFHQNANVKTLLPRVARAVEKGGLTPTAAACDLLDALTRKPD